LANFDTNGSGVLSKSEAEAVTSIGDVFKTTSGIVNFPEFKFFTSVESLNDGGQWNTGAFYTNTTLKSISLPNSITNVSYCAFYDCAALETVEFGNNTLAISSSAFNGCKSLNVAIPSSVTSIGSSSFYNASAMASVVNCPNLTSLGVKAFTFSGIVGVVDLGSITELKNEATGQWYGIFQNCTSMRYAILPPTLAKIEAYTFKSCSKLEAFVFKNTTPATLSSSAFESTNNCPIYVPNDSLDTYKTASVWSTYSNRIKPISQLATDNPTLYAEIEEYL
jgi:hypothetical protein